MLDSPMWLHHNWIMTRRWNIHIFLWLCISIHNFILFVNYNFFKIIYQLYRKIYATSINSMNSIECFWYRVALAFDNICFDIMHICWPQTFAIPISISSPIKVILLISFLVSNFINVSKSCDSAWYKCVHSVCISIWPREFDIFSFIYLCKYYFY